MTHCGVRATFAGVPEAMFDGNHLILLVQDAGLSDFCRELPLHLVFLKYALLVNEIRAFGCFYR